MLVCAIPVFASLILVSVSFAVVGVVTCVRCAVTDIFVVIAAGSVVGALYTALFLAALSIAGLFALDRLRIIFRQALIDVIEIYGRFDAARFDVARRGLAVEVARDKLKASRQALLLPGGQTGVHVAKIDQLNIDLNSGEILGIVVGDSQ